MRALAGEKTGFAYSDEIVLPALLEAARAARAIAREGGKGQLQAWHAHGGAPPVLGRSIRSTSLADARQGARCSRSIDREARALDPRVKQVMASLAAVHEIVLVAASDGTLAADVRPLVRMNVSVIVEQNGRREQGYAGGGGRYRCTSSSRARRRSRLGARSRAPGARQPRSRAGAGRHDDRGARARAGRACCCTRPSATASKATSTARAPRRSPAASGEQVASDLCTVVDDGTLPAAAARSTSTTKARRRSARR